MSKINAEKTRGNLPGNINKFASESNRIIQCINNHTDPQNSMTENALKTAFAQFVWQIHLHEARASQKPTFDFIQKFKKYHLVKKEMGNFSVIKDKHAKTAIMFMYVFIEYCFYSFPGATIDNVVNLPELKDILNDPADQKYNKQEILHSIVECAYRKSISSKFNLLPSFIMLFVLAVPIAVVIIAHLSPITLGISLGILGGLALFVSHPIIRYGYARLKRKSSQTRMLSICGDANLQKDDFKAAERPAERESNANAPENINGAITMLSRNIQSFFYYANNPQEISDLTLEEEPRIEEINLQQ